MNGIAKATAMKLGSDLYYVGVSNPALRVFDIIMMAEYGTTYNAYLMTGEKNVLVETVHEDYFDEFIDKVESVLDINQLDYLILNHTEPDHSGSVRKLLELNPNITIISSVGGGKFLKNIVGRDFTSMTVKQGDTLDIGGGKQLEFIIAPMLHWPDSMFTYMRAEKVIFTCDFLGAHYCEPRILDSRVSHEKKYLKSFEYYYQAIFGPFKPYVIQGLDKIKDLPIEMVCCSHGPVLVEHIQERMDDYRKWSTPIENAGKPKALILVASSYGYTKQLAEAMYDEIRNDVDVQIMDVVETPLAVSAQAANEANILFIGTCTINRDAPKPLWDVISSIDAINSSGKKAGVFGSYGWSGEGIGMIKDRLASLKYKVEGDGCRCLFRPSDADLQNAREYARSVITK